MFLKPQILKKMMKEAYKGSGLVLAATKERYYISGYWWELEVEKEFLTKTIAAQIIELAGEFPKTGERFCAKENGNQMETCLKMEIGKMEREEGIEITKTMILSKTGVLQRVLQKSNGEIALLNNKIVEMISDKEVDRDNGEHEHVGPAYSPKEGKVLFWNNVMRFRVGCRIDDENAEMIHDLQEINLIPEVR